jgi:hypothetical protein
VSKTNEEALIDSLTTALSAYYKSLHEKAVEAGEDWDDERMDIIGQNGNDGLHYVTNDDGSTCAVQHKMKDSGYVI